MKKTSYLKRIAFLFTCIILMTGAKPSSPTKKLENEIKDLTTNLAETKEKADEFEKAYSAAVNTKTQKENEHQTILQKETALNAEIASLKSQIESIKQEREAKKQKEEEERKRLAEEQAQSQTTAQPQETYTPQPGGSVVLPNGNTAGEIGAYAAKQMEAKTGVPASTWEYIIARESNGNPNARNPSGAFGLFQLMPIHGNPVTVDEQIEVAARVYHQAVAYFGNGLQPWGM